MMAETVNAPPELADRRIWLTWRIVQRERGKPDKVPYYATTGVLRGKHGTPEDRAELVSYDQAVAAAAERGHDGVGLALLPDEDVVALDFDDLRGRLDEVAEEVIRSTYTERSPSGNGMRALFAEIGLPRSDFRVLEPPLGRNRLHLIVGKAHPRAPEIITQFNKGLRLVRENGIFEDIVQQFHASLEGNIQ